MKAPALRVIKARIEAAVRTENQALQQEQIKHQEVLAQHRKTVHTLLSTAFAENAAAYVTYGPEEYRGLCATPAWNERVKDITAANPEPIQKRLATVHVGIASLDISVRVADINEAKWKKFAKECDEAFLEVDAKKILEALEAIVG